MTVLVFTAGILVSYPLVYRQLSMLNEQLAMLGQSLAVQAANNAVEPMFVGDDFVLQRLVKSMKEQPNVVSVLFINQDNNIIGTSSPRPPVDILTDELQSFEPGTIPDNNELQWFHAPVLFNDVVAGTVWIGLDKSSLLTNRRLVVSSAIVALTILMGGVMWLSIRLSHYLSQPINELIEAAKAINSGNYQYRITNSRSGEFAKVKEAFNNMAESLEQKLTLEKNISRFVSTQVAANYMNRNESELTLQGERVEASILFVDLVAYTQFSERYTPEIVAEVLNLYFSEFAAACHRFNGNVDKFIGDCAMLVFGCPASDDDHNRHALECALYIRDRICELNQQRKAIGAPWMDIRIGLAGGIVLAGLLGSPERLTYSVVGEAANLAARLCDRAPRGTILTDRTFLDSLAEQPNIKTYNTQRITVKGFSQPIDAMIVDQWAPTPLKHSP
jgi:adenylate cyclase